MTAAPLQDLHHHEWTVRETVNSESGAPTSWFECALCGHSYV